MPNHRRLDGVGMRGSRFKERLYQVKQKPRLVPSFGVRQPRRCKGLGIETVKNTLQMELFFKASIITVATQVRSLSLMG